MRRGTVRAVLCAAATAGVMGVAGYAQTAVYKAPAAPDWTALAKLPDFSGVWEIGGGGGGRGGAPAGPQLTPTASN